MLAVTDERLQRLRHAADAARRLHYAPYSGRPGRVVLAAAELDTGTVGGGSNVEIVNFTLTKHAEELAILVAFANDAKPIAPARLAAVYVAGGQPCGSCRQFAAEFARADAIWILESVDQEALQATPPLSLPREQQPLVVPFADYLPAPFLPAPRQA